MATGGWGTSSNPFQGGAAYDDLEQPSPAPAIAGSAYGAWGGAAPAPPMAPPPFAVAAVQPAPKKGGFFGRGGSKDTTPAPNSFATSVAAPGATNGSMASREAELARREAAVAQREAALAAGGGGAVSDAKNFPPCYPLIRHDISADIPPWNRSMIRFALIVELFEITGFLWNTIVYLIAVLAKAAPPNSNDEFTIRWFLVALLALVLGLPGSWFGWYKSMFNGARTDGVTFRYMMTFLLIFINIGWCGIMVAAPPVVGTYSCGVVPLIDLFSAGDSKSVAFGILCIVNICLWGIAGLGCWVCLGLAVKAYRRADQPRKAYEESYGPYVARGASRA